MIPRYLACVGAIYTARFCSDVPVDISCTEDGWMMQAALWAERAKNEGGDLYVAITQAFDHPDVVWL